MSSVPVRRTAFLSEARITLILAIPLIIGQLCSMGQGVVEMMLAGHLNAHTLGAVAIGANVFSLPLMAANGFMMAVPPSVAQLDGSGRRSNVPELFRQSLWLAVALGFALALLTWFGGEAVVRAVGAPEGLIADVGAFLRASSLGLPAIAVYFACRGVAAGLSATRVAMLFALLGLVLLVPIGTLLVYGGLGIPSLGAFGSGLAGAIVNWVQALAFYAWLRFAPRRLGSGRLGLDWSAGRVWPDLRAIFALVRLGAPICGSVLLEVGAFSASALAISRFGEIAAASHQIALNVAGLTFMVPLGLSMAITVRVGLAAGRRDALAVRRAGLAGLAIVLLTQIVSSCGMIGAPAFIASLYTPDGAVRAGAVTLLLLAGVFQMSDGIQVACSGALRGLKDAQMPMAICVIAYWVVAMPVGLVLAFTMDLRAPGMWVGLIAGLTAAAGLLFARFMRLTRPVRQREALVLAG
jgi:MATE family multidrug resistance protein